jgi:uncharacterized protein
MIVGAAIAHNFGLASSPAGATTAGIGAVIVGILVCIMIGLTMKEKVA